MKPASPVQRTGKLLFLAGILLLLLGLGLFLFTDWSSSLWLILISVLVNAAGLTLMGHKPDDPD